MTLSIVAQDPDTGSLGAAVTSRFFAVGSIVPWVRPGVGAVCSQALSDPRLGTLGLEALERGESIGAAVDRLAHSQANHEHLQLHGITADGSTAAFTGGDCVVWSGSRAADGVSVAGNMLAGPRVVEATLDAFVSSHGGPLAHRLLHAITAGEGAGGDKRGKQSAAVLTFGNRPYADVNLRVDDHPEPVAELWRLLEVGHRHYFAFLAAMPHGDPPAAAADRNVLEARVNDWISKHGNVDFSSFWSRDPWRE